jgi:integrase
MTVHGFRSSFKNWAAEKTKVPTEVVDKALAHKLPDRVEAAYRRTDFFERRRRLTNAWAQFVVAPKSAAL